MLIYLDTWLWSRLSQARSREPTSFKALLKVWHDRACELAVSRTHLLELRRHKDSQVRDARYRLVEALLPGRFDMLSDTQQVMNSVTNREIAIALARDLNLTQVLERVDRYWAGFPIKILDEADVAVLRQLEDPVIGTFLDLLYKALTLEATERKRAKGAPYQRHRMTSLPTEKLPLEQVERLVTAIEQQVRQTPIWQQATALLSAEQLAEGVVEGVTTIRKVLTRATQVGMRQAFVEHYAAPAYRKKDYTDQVIQRSTFRANVEEVVRSFGRITDPEQIASVADTVSTDVCPGTWLRDAVEIELRKSKSDPKPNDWFDLDHLTHLPYVDLFLSDAELVNNTMKVLRRTDTLPSTLAGTSPPLSVDGSLRGIQEIIQER